MSGLASTGSLTGTWAASVIVVSVLTTLLDLRPYVFYAYLVATMAAIVVYYWVRRRNAERRRLTNG
jgi:hypothetical protein